MFILIHFIGKNVANPTAMLLSATQMLDHIGLKQDATRLKDAINKVLTDRKVRTRDLGGFATTNQFTAAVIQNL
jgi:isocitrate dehydrogenase (NAD+)